MVKRYRQVAGFILAGGASSRMGRDKGLLNFGGVPLIVHTAQLLEPLVAEVTVVGSPSRYAQFGLRTIGDDARGQDGTGCGPLAGIATALAATRAQWNLIIACDLPYLSAEWLEWLLSRTLRSRAGAIVPRTERSIEPLAAVYRRECGEQVTAALARGVRKVSEAIAELRVDFVEPRQWRRIDRSEMILRNMNAPEDYEKAQEWWLAERLSESEHVRELQRTPTRESRSAPRRRK
jgi:molybdenum cofactor guanylyltransferase